MFRRAGIILACLAMFFIAGGHWAVMRSVAWVGMVQDFSRTDGFTLAMKKTFSGRYPCAMCKKVAEAQKSEEQKPLALKVDKKAEIFLSQRSSATLFPPAPSWLLSIPTVRLPASVIFDPPQPVPLRA